MNMAYIQWSWGLMFGSIQIRAVEATRFQRLRLRLRLRTYKIDSDSCLDINFDSVSDSDSDQFLRAYAKLLQAPTFTNC